MLKLFWIVLLAASCSTPDKIQDVYTEESNYFDYEYYSEDLSNLDTLDDNYDYFYYEEDTPPVYLEETETKDWDDWFFEDY
ncbi:MAG: hypothetical protein CME64_07440 [Halobacteriovoraceae bacterium]|nr:hypothetical protein [Halobacteriovoraceae bacterium]|tara:strand:+ start:40734 stop:40976 length:243 start_codon:yes stop_codon:yes gene_type:complete